MEWPKEFIGTGDKIRIKALEKLIVKPIQHNKLIANQVRITYFNQIITTNYYLFEFMDKTNEANKGYFYCGDYAAKQWLALTHDKPLDLFNPLQELQLDRNNNRDIRHRDNNENIPRNRQKSDLILILQTIIFLKDFKTPNTPIFDVLKTLQNNRHAEPTDRQLKAVNTIVYNLSGRNNYRTFIAVEAAKLQINTPFKEIDAESLNARINVLIDEVQYDKAPPAF